MKKPESFLEQDCDKVLKKYNLPFVATSSLGDGVADRIVPYKGLYLELEYKRHTQQRTNQKFRQRHLQSQGNYYFIIRSISELETVLQRMEEVWKNSLI